MFATLLLCNYIYTRHGTVCTMSQAMASFTVYSRLVGLGPLPQMPPLDIRSVTKQPTNFIAMWSVGDPLVITMWIWCSRLIQWGAHRDRRQEQSIMQEKVSRTCTTHESHRRHTVLMFRNSKRDVRSMCYWPHVLYSYTSTPKWTWTPWVHSKRGISLSRLGMSSPMETGQIARQK